MPVCSQFALFQDDIVDRSKFGVFVGPLMLLCQHPRQEVRVAGLRALNCLAASIDVPTLSRHTMPVLPVLLRFIARGHNAFCNGGSRYNRSAADDGNGLVKLVTLDGEIENGSRVR